MMTCCALYKILITNTNWMKTQNGRRYKSLQIVFSEEVAIYIYIQSGLPRGLEGSRTNTKSGAHNTDCMTGVWGHSPRKIFRFTCSEVCSGGFLRLLFVHAYSTYIPASCRLRSAVSDQKVRHTGP